MNGTKIFALLLLVVCLLKCTAHADACDPNSSAPLIAFSVKQDMARAKISYTGPASIDCRFSAAQNAHMSFVIDHGSVSFSDDDKRAAFACFVTTKRGLLNGVPITAKILATVFAGTGVKLESCIYSTDALAKQPKEVEAKVENAIKASPFDIRANERNLIVAALKDSNDNIASAARKLGISEAALKRKMKEYTVEATNS